MEQKINRSHAKNELKPRWANDGSHPSLSSRFRRRWHLAQQTAAVTTVADNRPAVRPCDASSRRLYRGCPRHRPRRRAQGDARRRPAMKRRLLLMMTGAGDGSRMLVAH